MDGFVDSRATAKRSLDDDSDESRGGSKRLKTSNDQLRAQNTDLVDQLAPVLRSQSLGDSNSSPDVPDLSASTVYVYQDPARIDKFLHEKKYKDYSVKSSKKRNNLRSSLAKGSTSSLHIDQHSGKRLTTLLHRRRHSICYGEPKTVTDKLPINSGRKDTEWNKQQDLLQKTTFSAVKRIEAIEQQSKTRPGRNMTEDLLEAASIGMISEFSEASSEYRYIFIIDLDKAPSANMAPGKVLTDALDLNRTLAMDQDLYRSRNLLGGWTRGGTFDLSRPMWSKPEVRCSRIVSRMMSKIYRAKTESPMPPRVSLDNPRSGNHGRAMETQTACDTTLRIMLDPNTVNTDAKFSKEDRDFFSQYGEAPTNKPEWRKRQ